MKSHRKKDKSMADPVPLDTAASTTPVSWTPTPVSSNEDLTYTGLLSTASIMTMGDFFTAYFQLSFTPTNTGTGSFGLTGLPVQAVPFSGPGNLIAIGGVQLPPEGYTIVAAAADSGIVIQIVGGGVDGPLSAEEALTVSAPVNIVGTVSGFIVPEA